VRRPTIGPVAVLAGLALAMAAAATPWLAAQAPPPAQATQPVFKSGVELIAVDVAVVDKNGYPVAGLRPDQFQVTVDGKPRRVVSAEFMEFATRTGAPRAPLAARAVTPTYTSNEQVAPSAPQGRLIYLAVDQGSFKPLGARGAMEAARRFIDRLQPEDRIGLVAFPEPVTFVAASLDHEAARAATTKLIGSAQPFRVNGIDKNVSLSEAIDIRAGDTMTTEKVFARECGPMTGANRAACENDVRNTAISIGRNAEQQATRGIAGIKGVIRGLAQIRERKTLVLVSGGLPVADRSGIDLQLNSTVADLGREAAAANLNFFVLHIDSGFLDAFSAEERTISDTLFRDLSMMSSGLETIAGASGGSLARVVAGADFAFDQVLRETTAAYLLGVEPLEGDRDGKTHRISVKVDAPGAEVRSRREVRVPVAVAAKAATPEDALGRAFSSSRLELALPIRLATFNMGPSADGRQRVMVSAEIGGGASGPADIWIAFATTDASGRSEEPVGRKLRLRPRAGSPSSALSFAVQTLLSPGRYTLRFAAVDTAGRAGSLDHVFVVGLTNGDGVAMGDLVLLEPVTGSEERLDVVTDGRLRGDAVDAYVEIVPSDPEAFGITARFDVSDKPAGEPLITATGLMTRTPGTGNWSATARLDLADLPPGDYVVTATVLVGERRAGSMTRALRIQ
jgi:VWFA-related protein